jgi:hypothetical protein
LEQVLETRSRLCLGLEDVRTHIFWAYSRLANHEAFLLEFYLGFSLASLTFAGLIRIPNCFGLIRRRETSLKHSPFDFIHSKGGKLFGNA